MLLVPWSSCACAILVQSRPPGAPLGDLVKKINNSYTMPQRPIYGLIYLDLLLSIGRDGQLHTSIYDKRDDFNVHITNFPFLSSNIPSSPAYGVFISQLIRYARACSSYECFILRARRLSSKLLKQGYLVERLKSSFRNVKWHSDPWPTVTSLPIRLSTNSMTFIPSLTFTELWVVSIEHLQRVWLASRERLPFRTPGSVPHFGTC